MTSSGSNNSMWNDAQVENVLTTFLRQEQSALTRVDTAVEQRASADRASARNQSGQTNSLSMTSAATRPTRSDATGSARVVVLASAVCLVTVILITAGGNPPDQPSVADRSVEQDSAVASKPESPASAVVSVQRSHVSGRTPVENQPHGQPVHITDPDLMPGIGAGTDDGDLYLQGTEIEVFGVPGNEGQFSPARRPADNHRPAIAEPRLR